MSERLERDALVELCDQYSNVYPLSPTGARGWVRAKRELPKLDPEVYIEWDKTHWRYHGERDGWTYEHHFRPVDDTIPGLHHADRVIPDEGQPTLADILAEAQRQMETQRCPDCGELHDEPQDEFLATLAEAQEALLASDGYMIISLQPREVDGFTVYEPQLFSQHLTKTAQRMIEAQIIHLAAQLYEQRIYTEVKDLEEGA